jgi:hypothetical protein
VWDNAWFGERNTDVGVEKYTQFYCVFSNYLVMHLENLELESAGRIQPPTSLGKIEGISVLYMCMPPPPG